MGQYEARRELSHACRYALWRLSVVGDVLGQALLRKDNFVVRVCVTECVNAGLLRWVGLRLEALSYTLVVDGSSGKDEDGDEDEGMESEEAAMMYLQLRWPRGGFDNRQMVYRRIQ